MCFSSILGKTEEPLRTYQSLQTTCEALIVPFCMCLLDPVDIHGTLAGTIGM